MSDWKNRPIGSFTWPMQIVLVVGGIVWVCMVMFASIVIASAATNHIDGPWRNAAMAVVLFVVNWRLLKP